jgi:hypothetical protein
MLDVRSRTVRGARPVTTRTSAGVLQFASMLSGQLGQHYVSRGVEELPTGSEVAGHPPGCRCHTLRCYICIPLRPAPLLR